MPISKIKSNLLPGSFLFLFLLSHNAFAGDSSFTDSLMQADIAQKNGDIQGASRIYDEAQKSEVGNASNLCVLSRRYCDLTYSTNSISVQKQFIACALACAQRAVTDDPTNATAHASVAVCYAKSCDFANIKTELAYSRLIKQEADKAIALDPTQDVAYYLLGRWNFAIANAGLFSRAYVKVIYGGLPHASSGDAIHCFQKAIELSPNCILYHAGLAMACEAAGEKKMQIIELKKCCALKPFDLEDMEARSNAEKKLASLKP